MSQQPEDPDRDKELPPFTTPAAGGPWQAPGSGEPPSAEPPSAEPPSAEQPSGEQPPSGGQTKPLYGGRGAFGESPGQQAHGGPGQQPYGAPGQQPYGGSQGQPPYGGYQPYPTAGYGGGWTGKDPALAEWWRRLLARFIDGFVIGILVSPFWISAFVSMYHRFQAISNQYPNMNNPVAQAAFRHSVNQMTGRFILIGVASAALAFGYDWLQHGLWGQTLGKRALGTKVVKADTRAPISGGAACGRAAVYALVPNVPYAGSLFGLLNVLWLTWDSKRQCLHDKAASTVVVKKSMLTPPPAAPSSA